MKARLAQFFKNLPQMARNLPHWIKTTVQNGYKTPEFWLTFSAYAIPLAFLFYILYWNFLPFGYNKTFVINVGFPKDTDSSKIFYLQPSAGLSNILFDASNTPYRTLNGIAYAIYQPQAVLKNATITASVVGENITIISPAININPDSMKWDYDWNFSTATPSSLTGDSFYWKENGCEYFDGQSQLQLPDSSNMFESGPFTVYAQWTPKDPGNDFQEIVGHFNWELLQDKNDVRFFVGRMNNGQGPVYSVSYQIPDPGTFFEQSHTALAVYSPSDNGSIYLYIDGFFVGRTEFGNSIIWPAYNKNINLSFGKATHGAAHFFNGCINRIAIRNDVPQTTTTTSFHYSSSQKSLGIPLFAATSSILKSITLTVHDY